MAHASATTTTLAKWYVTKLKTYPLLTNVGSAMILMTTGDVLAQELETTTTTTTAKQNDNKTLSSSSSYVVTMSSLLERFSADKTTTNNNKKEEHVDNVSNDLSSSSSCYDFNRTCKMVGWSVGIYTPFYVGLYRLYDKYLPKQTPVSIATRVVLSFVCSIPVNAAFYVYGSAMDGITIDKNQHINLTNPSSTSAEGIGSTWYATSPSKVTWDYHTFYNKATYKLTQELPNTIVTSGTCWIPINLFTFTAIPSHLRPVSLMFFSIFWNCYLSVSQHRMVYE